MRMAPQASAWVHIAPPSAEGEGTILTGIMALTQAQMRQNAFLHFYYAMGGLNAQRSLIIIQIKLFISCFSF